MLTRAKVTSLVEKCERRPDLQPGAFGQGEGADVFEIFPHVPVSCEYSCARLESTASVNLIYALLPMSSRRLSSRLEVQTTACTSPWGGGGAMIGKVVKLGQPVWFQAGVTKTPFRRHWFIPYEYVLLLKNKYTWYRLYNICQT